MRILLILTFLFAVSVPPVEARAADVTGREFSAAEKKTIEDFFGERAADAVSGTNKDKTRKNKNAIEDGGKKNKNAIEDGGKKNKIAIEGVKKNKIAIEGGGKKNKTAKSKGKSGELPPGLQKHLEKHGTLPPGLAKKKLPPGLAKRLGLAGSGLERLIVDDDVLLVEAATGVVLDIIKDIVVGGDK